MHEEPFRWVEAIANRREYIEDQLASGSPIVALGYRDGILLFTLSRERQKIFEIYDRIALGGIGHPGDLERLRLTAIELASTEGFARSADDVALRRLANYSLSPALKAAFEQIYGAPFLARLLFAELGRGAAPNLFLRLDYDGSIRTNGGSFGRTFEDFGVIAGRSHAIAQMESSLRERKHSELSLADALRLASRTWAIGHIALSAESDAAAPDAARITEHLRGQLANASAEAAVLEKSAPLPAAFRALAEGEVRTAIA